MPHYYLHVCNGQGFAEDESGQEFADEGAARRAAIDGLRDLMSAELRQGELNMGSFVEIENAAHELVATVSFEEAVRVRHAQGQRP